MKPPIGGPMIGPTSAGMVSQAMASTSLCLSIERTSTSRPTGVIMAPPMPCTMRAITNPVSDDASAQPIEPDNEDRDGSAEHGACAEPVGGPAARRDEDREREQIRGDGELERQRVRADIGRDRR